jgi:hypothetical protein
LCDEELPIPWLPKDVTRSFFAYGLFKPGELAYFQIRDLATSTPATATGQLRIRDGVPFLAPSAPGYTVGGALVSFAPADAEEGYGRIAAMEPKHLYSWGTIAVDDGVNDNGVDANVLLGRSPGQGHPLDLPDWDGWEDPLFVTALPLIGRRAKALRGRHGYEALFDRQMAYMLLWSAIERYLSLRYSLGEDVNQKIAGLINPSFSRRRGAAATAERLVHTHQVSVSVPASSSWEPLAVSARSNRAAATGRVVG